MGSRGQRHHKVVYQMGGAKKKKRYKKSIKSTTKKIIEHRKKIKDAYDKGVSNWYIIHWEKEINTFNRNIEKSKKKIKRTSPYENHGIATA